MTPKKTRRRPIDSSLLDNLDVLRYNILTGIHSPKNIQCRRRWSKLTNYQYIQECNKDQLVSFLCREIGWHCDYSCPALKCCKRHHEGFIDWLEQDREIHAYNVRNTNTGLVVSETSGTIRNMDFLQSCSAEELSRVLCWEIRPTCGTCIARNYCANKDGFIHWLMQDREMV